MTELSLSNPVVRSLLFYSTVCILKMGFLGLLTSLKRVGKSVYVNPEDLAAFGNKDPKIKLTSEDRGVERVRRNHLNDLENIPAFILLAFCYVLIDPSPSSALLHFRVFTGARIVHTLCYQAGLQPWRALAHIVGLGVTGSMAVQILSAVW